MRLLLVEDDAMVGARLRRGLRRDGFDVDWVLDGRTALSFLQSEAYGVVVLDLHLPRAQRVAFLRALHRRQPAPVVIINPRAGAAHLLVAASALDELVSRVRAAVYRHAGRQDSEEATIALPFSWG